MKSIKSVIQPFKRLSLADIDSVSLLNRTDHKYCLRRSELPDILEALKDSYALLEIDGKTIFPYDNTYFDTENDRMFLDHQNERATRYKIRIRQYVQSQINFLEIKLRTNKGRTIKQRIVRDDFDSDFDEQEMDFLRSYSPFQASELKPSIKNKFYRMTLVNNELTERITVDLFPAFEKGEKEIVLENLVIIEIKQDRDGKRSLMDEVLKAKRIQKQSFSKYCIGRSLLDDDLKKNNFKPLLLKLGREYN